MKVLCCLKQKKPKEEQVASEERFERAFQREKMLKEKKQQRKGL